MGRVGARRTALRRLRERSPRYVAARACQVYEREYAIHFPTRSCPPAGRCACPRSTTGCWSAAPSTACARAGSGRSGSRRRARREDGEPSFRRTAWHEAVGRECRGVREGVGLLDQSSFAKYIVSGADASAYLEGLLANRPPPQDDRIALAQVLTAQGGIACDLTVTRYEPNGYYVVSAAATETHDLDVLRRAIPTGGRRSIDDVTFRYAVLTLAGPNARELVSRVVDGDVSREALPFFRSAHVDLDCCTVFLLRLSFVGELGFELHVRTDYAGRVERALREAGRHRPRGLRLPRPRVHAAGEGLPHVGRRPHDDDIARSRRASGSRCAHEGRSFPGRDVVARQAAEGVQRTLACLLVDAADADAHAWEPVYDGERAVGHVASGGYGYRVEQSIAYAYLPLALARPGRELQVEILGERRPAVVAEAPLYDPENVRLRG